MNNPYKKPKELISVTTEMSLYKIMFYSIKFLLFIREVTRYLVMPLPLSLIPLIFL